MYCKYKYVCIKLGYSTVHTYVHMNKIHKCTSHTYVPVNNMSIYCRYVCMYVCVNNMCILDKHTDNIEVHTLVDSSEFGRK